MSLFLSLPSVQPAGSDVDESCIDRKGVLRERWLEVCCERVCCEKVADRERVCYARCLTSFFVGVERFGLGALPAVASAC